MRISDWSSDVCASDLLLLGAQLHTEVGKLALAALAVLARAVFAAVDRGLRTAPDVFAHTAIDFVLGRRALAHRIRSEEHTSELQSLMRISYAVFCLTKKNSPIE